MSTRFTGAVNSEWYNGGNWSGGGVPDGSVPIVFDGTSPNCDLDFATFGTADAEAGIDFTGYTGTLSNTGAGFRVNVGGAVVLSAAMTAAHLQLEASNATITSHGFHIEFLNVQGGTTTLADDLVATGAVSTNGFGGTLNFNGKSLTAGDFSAFTGDTLTLAGATLTVPTFASFGANLIGASAWTLHATTSAVAHTATITNCDSTGVTLDGTDGCTDGGGNVNVTFPPPPSTTWTGSAGDGLWETAGNWTNGVPGGTDNVVLTGASDISLSTNAAINALDTSGFTGSLRLISAAGVQLEIANGLTMNAASSIICDATSVASSQVYVNKGTIDCNGAHIDALVLGSFVGGLGAVVINVVSAIDCGYSGNYPATPLEIGGQGDLHSTTIHLNGNTITYHGAVGAWQSEIGVESGLGAIDWTPGGKIVLITSNGDGTDGGGNSMQIFDAGQSFAFPPIEVQGNGRLFTYTDMAFSSLTIAGTVVRWAIAQPDWPTTPPAFNANVIGNLTVGCPVTGMNDAGDTPVGLDGLAIAVGGNFVMTGTTMTGSAAPWTLSVTGTAAATGTTFSRCNAGGGSTVNATHGCTDGGNNINVNFTASIPTSAGFWMM